jgi:DNA-binding GntR family transcriptional regulator
MEQQPKVIANRYSLSEQVRNHILSRIATGELAPGSKVIEARIAEELHVSTIPVREAIRELVAKRVLEYLVHRGARVRAVSMSETVDALRVKAVLEALAARLAGARLQERLPMLREYVQPILQSAFRHDFVEYQNQNQLFHRTIVEASGNQILLNQWDSLAFEVRTRFILDYLKVVDSYVLAREHEDILQAIEKQDPERVASLLMSHANGLVEYLERQKTINSGTMEERDAISASKS